MIAFNGDKQLKKDLLEEIKKHQEADEIAQGAYAEKLGNGKMKLCAVGCALFSYNAIRGKDVSPRDHAAFEPELGIPRVLARLTDRIFEGLQLSEAKQFPYEFIEAIPVGADLSKVWSKYIHWLLVDEKEGVIKFATKVGTKKAIQDVADLYLKMINGEAVKTEEWVVVRKAAYAAAYAADAAAYAAAAAAYAADAYAAYAYDAYAYADAAAAYAAADAAADEKARFNAFSMQKAKLLELFREAEVKN